MISASLFLQGSVISGLAASAERALVPSLDIQYPALQALVPPRDIYSPALPALEVSRAEQKPEIAVELERALGAKEAGQVASISGNVNHFHIPSATPDVLTAPPGRPNPIAQKKLARLFTLPQFDKALLGALRDEKRSAALVKALQQESKLRFDLKEAAERSPAIKKALSEALVTNPELALLLLSV